MVLAVALLTGGAACSDSSEAEGPTADDTVPSSTTATSDASTSTSTTTSTTEPELTPEQEVEAAYLAAVLAYYERLRDPNPDDPMIDQRHTGASRDQVRRRNRELVDRNQRTRFTSNGPPTPAVTSVELPSDSRAVILNCYVDDVVVYNVTSGEIIDDSVTTFEMESILVLEDGQWKLSEQLIVRKAPGPDGCEAR